MKEKGREEKKEKKKKKRMRRGLQERKQRYEILKFCMDFHEIVWISMELYG